MAATMKIWDPLVRIFNWVEYAHEALASRVLAPVGIHVLGAVVSSLRHRENLVAAMISGCKRSPGRADIA